MIPSLSSDLIGFDGETAWALFLNELLLNLGYPDLPVHYGRGCIVSFFRAYRGGRFFEFFNWSEMYLRLLVVIFFFLV
jgi:hypothetical protein